MGWSKHKTYKNMVNYLNSYGWEIDQSFDSSGFDTFIKPNDIAVDISQDFDEVVLIDDTGDFLHLPFNYYALVGAIVTFKQ